MMRCTGRFYVAKCESRVPADERRLGTFVVTTRAHHLDARIDDRLRNAFDAEDEDAFEFLASKKICGDDRRGYHRALFDRETGPAQHLDVRARRMVRSVCEYCKGTAVSCDSFQ